MNFTFSPEQLMLFYIANQIVSAFVQALPSPNGNQFYNFFYKFVSLLTADFKSFSSAMPKQVSMTTKATGEIIQTSIPTATTLSPNNSVAVVSVPTSNTPNQAGLL
jgi:hypothetical protein